MNQDLECLKTDTHGKEDCAQINIALKHCTAHAQRDCFFVKLLYKHFEASPHFFLRCEPFISFRNFGSLFVLRSGKFAAVLVRQLKHSSQATPIGSSQPPPPPTIQPNLLLNSVTFARPSINHNTCSLQFWSIHKLSNYKMSKCYVTLTNAYTGDSQQLLNIARENMVAGQEIIVYKFFGVKNKNRLNKSVHLLL